MSNSQRKMSAWRFVKIDEILQDGAFHTIAELCETIPWDAPRTIQRDIEHMKLYFDAPIESTNKGIRYTERNFFIKTIPLSEGEVFSLAVLNPLLEQYRNTPLEKELRTVFKKIVDCLPGRVTLDTSFLKQKITFIPDKTEIIDSNIFQTVFTALKMCRLLTFDYRPLQKTTYMKRTIEPYHAVCQKGYWYVLGLCRDKNDVRIFSLGRMKNLCIENEKFDYPQNFKTADYFDAEMGVWLSDKTPLTVELLVSAEIGTYAMQRFWHSEQIVKENKDGSVYVKFETTQKRETLRWILGQGSTVRVLAPKELAEEVKAECLKVAGMYGGQHKEI